MQDRLTWIGGSFLVVVFIGVAAYFTARSTVPDPKMPVAQASVALEPPPEGAPQPKVTVVGGTSYEFGYMQQGTEQSHVFVFRNDGDGPLKLEKGMTSCTCTMSALASNEIPPGGTCDVTLKWEPKAEFPMFRQTATIYTNDRTNQTINLEITGVVAKVLNFSPSDLTIAKIPAGEPREAYFTIYSPVTASFDLGNIEYSDPKTKDFFTIKSVAAGDATLKQFGGKSGYEFTVTIKPGLPLGHFRQRLKIHHSIPNIEPVEIPIAGSIVGDVSIKGGVGLWNEEAGVLLLGRVFQRQGLKQNLKLYVKDAPADFAVESVKSTPDDSLKVECSAPKRVGQVTVVDVQISIPPGTRTQVHMGTAAEPLGEIIIRTNHPRTPEVKMLVKFDVVDA